MNVEINEENESGGGLELAPGLRVPTGVVGFRYSRSSGPGGQNVNKVNTKATLLLDLEALAGFMPDAVIRRLGEQNGSHMVGSTLTITSHEHRSQIANRNECLDRLRKMILQARIRPKIRRPTKPTRGSKERRLESKRVRSQTKAGRRANPEE